MEELLEHSWLGLSADELDNLPNALAKTTLSEVENPHLHILGIMRNPDYFGFACKHILNKDLMPFQLVVLKELWIRAFPLLIGTRGFSKSFTLAVYVILRALFCQGSKIVLVGSAFRQSKVIFNYCEEIWKNAPLLRDLCGTGSGPKRQVDVWTFNIGESTIIAIPMGNGEKIRGLRANILIADEFKSIDVGVFEHVISGFSSVSMSPVQKVKAAAKRKMMEDLGFSDRLENEPPSIPGLTTNQTILSGTCFWSFNHFYQYWKKWKSIIESRGNKDRLEEIFGGAIPNKFNWKDYSIIQVPVELLPDSYMDMNTVSKAKATIHKSFYLMEYGARFCTDSDGFYPRALVESCTVGNNIRPLDFRFNAVIRGHQLGRFVLACDPASGGLSADNSTRTDNFSIVILELCGDHRRVVYCWTTSKQRFKAKLKRGEPLEEHNFYKFCAKKIRELYKTFHVERIAMDSMGGSAQILELLADEKELMDETDKLLLPIIEDGVDKDTDRKPGDHCIELCTFAKADWVSFANHGMKKDLETQTLLFPTLDAVEIGLSIEEDKVLGRVKMVNDREIKLGDTLEDIALEIEELKDELAQIEHSQTSVSGRERWDVPDIKLPDGKKGKLRKDRYSALLMANAVSRSMQMTVSGPQQSTGGGFAQDKEWRKGIKALTSHQNPSWYDQFVENINYGTILQRGRS